MSTLNTTVGNQIPLHQSSISRPLGLPIESEKERLERQTKIVATLGPASSSEDRIRELVISGVNVFRLNFSHGTHAEHTDRLNLIRKVAHELNCPVAILQDLCGPKLRITELAEGDCKVNENQVVDLKYGSQSSFQNDKLTLTTQAFKPHEILKVGQRVFLADGKIELIVTGITESTVTTKVTRAGQIRSKVGIAMPDSDVRLPALTEKDIKDLAWGAENNVDYVALSFVREAADVMRLKEEMKKLNVSIPIIAKIERKIALDNLSEILANVDAAMVARGDLGVDIPPEKVPAAQKKIIAAAHKQGIPVIVATQMLLSMTESAQATRSEINDVERAAGDGADALMLSEETAIGKFPGEAVRMMARAAKEGELSFDYNIHNSRVTGEQRFECPDVEVLALSAAEASISSKIQAIIVCSEEPQAAALVAKHRPRVPIFAYSQTSSTLTRSCLPWGIHSMNFDDNSKNPNNAFRDAAQKYFLINPEAKEFGALTVIITTDERDEPKYSMRIKRLKREEFES